METGNWEIQPQDILRIETQRNERTGKDFAAVEFRHKGTVKFAVVKDLVSKPSDMDLNMWCLTVLNTHYLVKAEEKKRGRKISIARPVGL